MSTKTIKFTSNYGHFDYRMTAEIGDDVNEATTALCLQGLANICYRVAGSSVDKELGVKERKSVEYNEDDAQRINTAVSKKLTEMLAADKTKVLGALNMSFAVTGQHEFGDTDKGTKEAEAVWSSWQSDKKPGEKDEDVQARFALRLAKIGLTEDNYTDESAIVAIAKTLREARKAAAEAAKQKLSEL